VVLFKVEWYILLLQDYERIVIDHDNGFTMINTTRYELNTKPCVLPSQCEEVFYSQVLCRSSWSFVVIFDPRGRSVKYIFCKEDVHEEDVGEKEEVLDEEDNEVDHPIIGSHDRMLHLDDDLILDIPDVVMENLFNDYEGLDTNYATMSQILI